MRRISIASCVFAVLFVVVACASIGKVMFRARHGFGDHIAYYRAAERLAAGADPYAPTGDTYVYLYPPVWAVMVRPLTVAGPVVYGAVWALLLGASWFAARRLVRRLCGAGGGRGDGASDGGGGRNNIGGDGAGGGWVHILPDLILLRFLLGAWSSGQVTLPLQVLVLGGLLLAVEGRCVAGAALIAVAGSIKVYPLILAGALWRLGGRRAVAALCGVTLAVSVAPALFVGPTRFVALVRDGFLGAGMANLESQRWWSGRCAPLATAWHGLGGETGAGLKLAELLWAAALAAAVVALFPARPEGRRLWLGFAVLSMLVATPMLGENYLAMLSLPVTVMVAEAAARPAGDPVRRLCVGALVGATVLLNVHSPMIVGRARCDALERLGLSAMGLMLLWTALGAALAASRSGLREAAAKPRLAGAADTHEPGVLALE